MNLENFDFEQLAEKSEEEIYCYLVGQMPKAKVHDFSLVIQILTEVGLPVDFSGFEYFYHHSDLPAHCRCGQPGRPRRQNTAYNDEKMNWAIHCDECQELADEYWQELWDEYNSSRM